MGRQTLFYMSNTDAIKFFDILKQKYNAEIISSKCNSPEISYFSEYNSKAYKCYITNPDFSFTPNFFAYNGMYMFDYNDMPVIEFILYYSNMNGANTGRIYWNKGTSNSYDNAAFLKWYNVCQGIIKKFSVHTEKIGGRNIYYWNNAWQIKNSNNPVLWVSKGKNLMLNVGKKCINNCIGCVRNNDDCAEIPNETNEKIEFIEKLYDIFKKKVTDVDNIIFGAYSEPLSPDTEYVTVSLIRKISENYRKNIIIISNGLAFGDVLSEIRNKIDKIYVFKPSDDICKYLEVTRSKYSKDAFRIMNNFIDQCLKMNFQIEVICASRQDVLSKIID